MVILLNLHDTKYFQKMVENVVMWALLALLCIVCAIIVFAPIILAVKVSPWWLALYALYLIAFFIAAIAMAAGKSEEYKEDRYEDH